MFKLLKLRPCKVDIIFQIDKIHVRKKEDTLDKKIMLKEIMLLPKEKRQRPLLKRKHMIMLEETHRKVMKNEIFVCLLPKFPNESRLVLFNV